MTDFPRSLALWAGTTDGARLSADEAERAGYWESFRLAIRQAELRQQEQLQSAHETTAAAEETVSAGVEAASGTPSDASGGISARPLSACRTQARYGAGPDTVRMGREYTAAELRAVAPEAFGASGDPAAAVTHGSAGGEEL